MAKQVVIKAPKQPPVKSEMDLMTLFDQFGNDEKCRMYLERLRWPYGVQCTRCGSEKISRIYKRNQFACDSCKLHFSVTSGTIFHDSHLPLHKWFLAVAFMTQAKKGMSAKQLQRHLGLKSYQTAWYLCHRIRKAMEESGGAPLMGIVEVDETRVTGRYDKRRNREPWETTVVAGTLIKRHFRSFNATERQNIESAIWAIPALPLAKTYTEPEAQRDRLLGCIPEDELSDHSKGAVHKARSTGTLI